MLVVEGGITTRLTQHQIMGVHGAVVVEQAHRGLARLGQAVGAARVRHGTRVLDLARPADVEEITWNT